MEFSLLRDSGSDNVGKRKARWGPVPRKRLKTDLILRLYTKLISASLVFLNWLGLGLPVKAILRVRAEGQDRSWGRRSQRCPGDHISGSPGFEP